MKSNILNSNDITLIKKAAIDKNVKTWKNPILKPVKDKIKDYYLKNQKNQCCYCKKNLTGEFRMVIDIEHILPKSRFPTEMFTLCNLSIACKKCNMNIKRQDISFVTDIKSAENTPCKSELFKFIHPNSDKYEDHLHYIVEIVNSQKLIKYKIINDSNKGKYTYDYFRLKEREINTLNKVQGLDEIETVSELVDETTANEIRELLKNSH